MKIHLSILSVCTPAFIRALLILQQSKKFCLALNFAVRILINKAYLQALRRLFEVKATVFGRYNMSENNSNHSKQYFIVAVVSILVAAVGLQAWYMMNMKQQLDTLQGKHDDIASVFKPDSSAPSSTKARQPAVSQRMQKNLNAQARPGQQGQAIPVDPPSVFDNDFFNQPFFSQNSNPYKEIERMQREMDRMFNNTFSGYNNGSNYQKQFQSNTAAPQMNVQEDESKYTVIVNLPGAKEKNISVNLDGQQLTVKGEQDYKQEKKDEFGNVIFQQHRSGTFQRSITLPEQVKQNGMITHVDNGVLTITIPKVS